MLYEVYDTCIGSLVAVTHVLLSTCTFVVEVTIITSYSFKLNALPYLHVHYKKMNERHFPTET